MVKLLSSHHKTSQLSIQILASHSQSLLKYCNLFRVGVADQNLPVTPFRWHDQIIESDYQVIFPNWDCSALASDQSLPVTEVPDQRGLEYCVSIKTMASGSGSSSSFIDDGSSSNGNHGGGSSISGGGGGGISSSSSSSSSIMVLVMIVVNNVYNFIFLSNSKDTSRFHFTCCIVDEATQSQELETLIPLMLGVNTLVLVGDAQQRPAAVLSKVRTSLEPFFYLYFVCVCVCVCTCTHICTVDTCFMHAFIPLCFNTPC